MMEVLFGPEAVERHGMDGTGNCCRHYSRGRQHNNRQNIDCRRREVVVEAEGGSGGWMLALLGTRWHCAVSAEELGIWLIIS